jgi:hypothetical protein
MGGKGSGSPRGEILRLNNTIEINGKLEKTDFFNFLKMDLDDYGDLAMTPEEALAFKNTVVRMTYGTTAAIPLYCYGVNCLNKTCPFHKMGRYPLGKQCYVEVEMIKLFTINYIEELGVDVDSMTEMSLINKLVELELIDFRANLGLSGSTDQEAGSLLKKNITETDQMTSETLVIHPLLDAKDKIQRQRNQILDSFVATRREKYKKAAALKKEEGSDASKELAELRRRSEEMARKQEHLEVEKTVEEIREKTNNTILEGDWVSGEF